MTAVPVQTGSKTVSGDRDAAVANVLVIGATGFVGAAVVRAALTRHHISRLVALDGRLPCWTT